MVQEHNMESLPNRYNAL